VSGLSRQIGSLELVTNQIRKASIIDELSLNVEKTLAVEKTSNVEKTLSVEKTSRNGIFDYRHSIQIVDTKNHVENFLSKKSFSSTDVETQDNVENDANVDDAAGEVFIERRLTKPLSIFIVHNEVQSASCVQVSTL